MSIWLRAITTTATITGAIFLSGCQNEVCLEPLSDEAVILAFGDSLTEGVGVSLKHSYPSVLQKLTSLRVINSGISGETTAQGLERIEHQLDEHMPELLILLEGGNDMLRKKGIGQMQNNLQKMVDHALDRNIQVLLVAVPEPGLLADPPEAYALIAENSGVPLMNDVVTDLLYNSEYKSDPIHFNEAGYQRLAEAMYEKLDGCGALP